MAGSFTVVERPQTRDIMNYLQMMSTEAENKKIREQEQQRIDISREALGLQKEAAALNKPLVEAQTEAARLGIQQEKINLAQSVRDSLDKALQEALRQARVASAQGVTAGADKARSEADIIKTQRDLIADAMKNKEYDKAAQYAIPHVANNLIQDLQTQNQTMMQLINAQRAAETERHNKWIEEIQAYNQFASPTMSAVGGLPDAPYIDGLLRDQWKIMNSKDSSPEDIQASRQLVSEAVQKALDRGHELRMKEFEAEATVKEASASTGRAETATITAIFKALEDPDSMAPGEHLILKNALGSGKIPGRDFVLESKKVGIWGTPKSVVVFIDKQAGKPAGGVTITVPGADIDEILKQTQQK